MHLPNEILSLPVEGAFGVVSVIGLGIASYKAKKSFPDSKIPLMGVMGAFVFAAQMVNFPVLMGASGHLVGAVLLAILLGPHMAALTMAGILIIQCLIFQDGGILALGANIFNMGLVSAYGGYFIFRLVVSGGERVSKTRLFLASFLAAALGVFVSSLMVPFQVALSGISEAPLNTFFLLMGGIHLLIGLVEGLITAVVIQSLSASHPDFLSVKVASESPVKPGWVLAILGIFALVTAGGLSLLASELPDGLEWSLGKWNLKTEKLEIASPGAKKMVEVQEKIALFPDYSHPSQKGKYWTSVAGLVGTVLAALLALALAWFGKKKKGRHHSEDTPKENIEDITRYV